MPGKTPLAPSAAPSAESVLAYPRTFALRRQHAEISTIVVELEGLLDAKALSLDGTSVRSLIAALGSKLTVHLAMEDRFLYPRLLDSPDAVTRKLAKEYVAEMGGLAGQFTAYLAKWGDAPTIQNDAVVFASETRTLLATLKKRIAREDRDLYPLLDRS